MQRQKVIIVQDKWTNTPEVFGNFKKACEQLKLPYHSLKMKPFPIHYKDSIIHKVEFK
jgi:hypothetical protein